MEDFDAYAIAYFRRFEAEYMAWEAEKRPLLVGSLPRGGRPRVGVALQRRKFSDIRRTAYITQQNIDAILNDLGGGYEEEP